MLLNKKFKISHRIIFSFPAIILTVAIIIVSDMSQPPLPDIGLEFTDKIAHFLAYFCYGLCITAFYSVNFHNWTKNSIILGVIIFGSVFAASDEIHQYFVPGRDCDFFDWLADFCGIVASLLLLKFIRNFVTTQVYRL